VRTVIELFGAGSDASEQFKLINKKEAVFPLSRCVPRTKRAIKSGIPSKNSSFEFNS
jgi:hypothetical protein